MDVYVCPLAGRFIPRVPLKTSLEILGSIVRRIYCDLQGVFAADWVIGVTSPLPQMRCPPNAFSQFSVLLFTSLVEVE